MDSGQNDDYDWLWAPPSESNKTAHQPYREGDPHRDELPPPVLPPAGSSGRPPKTKRKRKGGGFRKILTLLVTVWLAFTIGVPIVAWGQLTRFDANPGGDRPAAGATRTFLLIGTDERPHDRARGRTDTILLLTWGSGPSVLTSIPRDSLVPIPGQGRNKINAAHAWGGPPLLVHTLEETTGLRIDGVMHVGFRGLVDVVDAVDGITVCPDRDMKDRDSKLNIRKGCQTVDGKTALAYSRNRKSHQTGDIARGQAQREVIGGIGAAIRSPMTALNPVRWSRTNMTLARSVGLSDDVSMFGAARFAWVFSRAMGGSGLNCTVPIADFAVNWDQSRASKYFAHLRDGTTDQLGSLCTASGLPS